LGQFESTTIFTEINPKWDLFSEATINRGHPLLICHKLFKTPKL